MEDLKSLIRSEEELKKFINDLKQQFQSVNQNATLFFEKLVKEYLAINNLKSWCNHFFICPHQDIRFLEKTALESKKEVNEHHYGKVYVINNDGQLFDMKVTYNDPEDVYEDISVEVGERITELLPSLLNALYTRIQSREIIDHSPHMRY